jgi:thioredoxin 1
MAVHFSDADFQQEVIQSNIPVVVDFYAEWCGPCKMMAPIIDKLSAEYEGKVKIGKVDVEANERVSNEYMVQSIPTLFFFKDGKVVNKLLGYKSEEELKRHLQTLL